MDEARSLTVVDRHCSAGFCAAYPLEPFFQVTRMDAEEQTSGVMLTRAIFLQFSTKNAGIPEAVCLKRGEIAVSILSAAIWARTLAFSNRPRCCRNCFCTNLPVAFRADFVFDAHGIAG